MEVAEWVHLPFEHICVKSSPSFHHPETKYLKVGRFLLVFSSMAVPFCVDSPGGTWIKTVARNQKATERTRSPRKRGSWRHCFAAERSRLIPQDTKR